MAADQGGYERWANEAARAAEQMSAALSSSHIEAIQSMNQSLAKAFAANEVMAKFAADSQLLGGAWIEASQEPLRALAEQMSSATFKQFADQMAAMARRLQWKPTTPVIRFPDLPADFLESMADSVAMINTAAPSPAVSQPTTTGPAASGGPSVANALAWFSQQEKTEQIAILTSVWVVAVLTMFVITSAANPTGPGPGAYLLDHFDVALGELVIAILVKVMANDRA